MGKSYVDLLNKFGPMFQKSEVKPEEVGLTDAGVKALVNLPLEGFIDQLVKALKKSYDDEKDTQFKAKIDSDKYSMVPGGKFARSLSKFLNGLSSSITTKDTKNALASDSEAVSKRVVAELYKIINPKYKAPVAPVKKGPLTKEELKGYFNISDGVIKASFSKSDYNEAVDHFKNLLETQKMTESEVNEYIDRFHNAYVAAVGDRPEESLLTEAEAKLFNYEGKKLSLSDLGPKISEHDAGLIAGTIIGKRTFNKNPISDKDKEDFITRLFNTIRDVKIKSYKTLTDFDKKWLTDAAIKDFSHRAINPKIQQEFYKDEEGNLPQELTKGERRKIKRDQAFVSGIKPDDWFRTLEFTNSALSSVATLSTELDRRIDPGKVKSVVDGLKSIIPTIGDSDGKPGVESRINRIEDILEGLGIDKRSYSSILRVVDGAYSPSIKEDLIHIKEKKDKLLEKLKKMKLEGKTLSKDQHDEAKKELLALRSKKKDFENISNKDLKALTDAVNNYLKYIDEKRAELNKFKESQKGSITDLEFLNNFISFRDSFRNLTRSEQFLVRWNRSTALTSEEKQLVEDSKKDAPFKVKKDGEGVKSPMTREAVNLNKFDGAYKKLTGKLDSFSRLKDRVDAIIKIVVPKMLSIIEFNPDGYNNLIAQFEGSDKQKSEEALNKIRTTYKALPGGKFNFSKNYVHNPYGGVGPDYKEVLDDIEKLANDIKSLNIGTRIEAIEKFLVELENVRDWVKIDKNEQVKSASIMLKTASTLRKIAMSILGAKEETPTPAPEDSRDLEDDVDPEKAFMEGPVKTRDILKKELADANKSLKELGAKLEKKGENPDKNEEYIKIKNKMLDLNRSLRYEEFGRTGPRALKPSEAKIISDTKLKAFYDTVFHRKRKGPSGARDVPNFFLEDTTKMAGKFIELLEKQGIPDIISATTEFEKEVPKRLKEIEALSNELTAKKEDPYKNEKFVKLVTDFKKYKEDFEKKTDISKQVDAAVSKMTEKGGLERYLGNAAKRKVEEDRSLKNSQKIIKDVKDLMEGTGDKPGLEQVLGNLESTFVPKVEELLNFIKEPLSKIEDSVESEKDKISEVKVKELKKSEKLKNLLDLAKKTKYTDKYSLLDVIGYNSDKKELQITDVSGKEVAVPMEVKDFFDKYNAISTKEKAPGERGEINLIEVVKKEGDWKSKLESLKKDLEKSNENPSNNKNYIALSNNLKWAEESKAKLLKEFKSRFKLDVIPDFSKDPKVVDKKVNYKRELVEDDVKEFFKEYSGSLATIKSGGKLKSKEKEKLLATLSSKFKLNYPDITPTFLEDLREDFSVYLRIKLDRFDKLENEFLRHFSKITDQEYDRLPNKKDIEDQWEKITGKAIKFDEMLEAKGKALSTLKDIPEDTKKIIQRQPVDVTSKWWYKAIVKDKSHHKTRWIENLLKQSSLPITSDDEFNSQYSELARLAAEADLDVTKNYNKSKAYTKAHTDSLFKELDANIASIRNMDPEKVDLKSINMEVDESLSAVMNTKVSFNLSILSYSGFIFNLNRLKEYAAKNKPYSMEDISNKSETYVKKEDTEKSKEIETAIYKTQLSKLEALINKTYNSIKSKRDSVTEQLDYIHDKSKILGGKVDDAYATIKSLNTDIEQQISDLKTQNKSTTKIERYKYNIDLYKKELFRLKQNLQYFTNRVNNYIKKQDDDISKLLGPEAIKKTEHPKQDPDVKRENLKKEYDSGMLSEDEYKFYLNQLNEGMRAKLLKEYNSGKIPKDKYEASLKGLEESFQQKSTEDEKKILKRAAYHDYEWFEPDTGDSEDKDEQDTLLEIPDKDISRGTEKAEFFKTIKKTINYLGYIAKNFSKVETKEGYEPLLNTLDKIGEHVPFGRNDIVSLLKKSIIPGLYQLIKQKVNIDRSLVVTIEDSVEKLDKLMQDYTEKRSKIRRTIETYEKLHGDSFAKIQNSLDFIYQGPKDPKDPDYKEGPDGKELPSGSFIDFTEKEKKIIRNIFLRQVYKHIDTIWSKIQSTYRHSMGEKYMKNYDIVFKTFSKYCGAQTNNKIMGVLNMYKASVRASPDEKTGPRIKFKSQVLENELEKIYQKMHALSLDPTKAPSADDMDKEYTLNEVNDKIKAIKDKVKKDLKEEMSGLPGADPITGEEDPRLTKELNSRLEKSKKFRELLVTRKNIVDWNNKSTKIGGIVAELNNLIKDLKKKEEGLDAIFGAMTKGADLGFLSSLRENLVKRLGEDDETIAFMPELKETDEEESKEKGTAKKEEPVKTGPAEVKEKAVSKKKPKINEEEAKAEVKADVIEAVKKVEEEAKIKQVPEYIDDLLARAEMYFNNLDDLISGKSKTTASPEGAPEGTPKVEKLSYRNSPHFNANILYGSVMQGAIRNQLKRYNGV